MDIPPASSRLRVLVVDDDEDTVTTTAALLGCLGFEVEAAQDPKAGLELALQSRRDLLLLDLAMPGVTGYDVARTIQAQPNVKLTLLVAVSGHGQNKDILKCAEVGFDLHLIKPVEPAVLEQLAVLIDRSDAVFDRTRKLDEEGRSACTSLLLHQLTMAGAYIELAQKATDHESRAAHLSRALRLYERILIRQQLVPTNKMEFKARIADLRQRLAAAGSVPQGLKGFLSSDCVDRHVDNSG